MIREIEPQIKSSIGFIDNDVPFVDSVFVDEFKSFARIDNNAENASIQSILAATFQACEKYLGRMLISRRMYYGINAIERETELPYPPLQTVESISIRQEDGTLEAIDTAEYFVITERIPGSIVFKQDYSLPVALVDVEPFVIKYTAGYGDNACDIPDAIKHAILVWANDGYQNRVIQAEPPIEIKSLLSLYMVERI
jgi:uncharacterized phiE125 gp8 family phage protein